MLRWLTKLMFYLCFQGNLLNKAMLGENIRFLVIGIYQLEGITVSLLGIRQTHVII